MWQVKVENATVHAVVAVWWQLFPSGCEHCWWLVFSQGGTFPSAGRLWKIAECLEGQVRSGQIGHVSQVRPRRPRVPRETWH